MTIQQAIDQLKLTIRSYTAQDELGMPLIPVHAQRPVYLLGAPGLGKTAIVAQAAEETGIGFVSYTMTHHTRQSALGLPEICREELNGHEYSVTEYTMPEIFAGVYRCIRDTGLKNGILFLDEINCVSETLMPAMLELLQKKRFGQFALPDGWMIVCAGNPESYNRSAHPFDPVTSDRLRVIEIEPDLEAWLDYAAGHGVHSSVRGYLILRPNALCHTDGDRIVSPRSWTDLSDMLLVLEQQGITPDRAFFAQYLQCAGICGDFSLYYSLCRGTAQYFSAENILSGTQNKISLSASTFEEQLCCILLLTGALNCMAQTEKQNAELHQRLGYFADGVLREGGRDTAAVCKAHLERMKHALQVRRESGALSPQNEASEKRYFAAVEQLIARVVSESDHNAALRSVAAEVNNADVSDASAACANAIRFVLESLENIHIRVVFLAELRRCAELKRVAEILPEYRTLCEVCDPDRREKELRSSI